MNAPGEITLDSETLRQLVARLGPPASTLSPLAPASALFARPFGVAGAPVDPLVALRFLEVPHQARTLVQLELVLEAQVFSHILCVAMDGTRSVLLTPTRDGLILREPPPVELLVAGVSNYLGSSALQAVRLSASLSADAAWLLCAALDLQRRRSLMVLAGTAAPGLAAFDGPTLVRALTTAPTGWQSVTSIVAAVSGQIPRLEPGPAEWAFDQLVQSGHISGGAEGFVLAGEALAFAQRFLIVDDLLRIQVAREAENGTIETAALWFVQAGVHDVLMIEVAEGAVSLEAVSAAAALDILTRVLVDPDAALPGVTPRLKAGKHGTELLPAFAPR